MLHKRVLVLKPQGPLHVFVRCALQQLGCFKQFPIFNAGHLQEQQPISRPRDMLDMLPAERRPVNVDLSCALPTDLRLHNVQESDRLPA